LQVHVKLTKKKKSNFLLKQTGTKVEAHRSRKTVMRKFGSLFFLLNFIFLSQYHTWGFFRSCHFA